MQNGIVFKRIILALFIVLAVALPSTTNAERLTASKTKRGISLRFLGNAERIAMRLSAQSPYFKSVAKSERYIGTVSALGSSRRAGVATPVSAMRFGSKITVNFRGAARSYRSGAYYAVQMQDSRSLRVKRLPSTFSKACAESTTEADSTPIVAAATAPSAYYGREIEVSVLADGEFTALYGAAWQEHVQTLLNAAESVYRNQVGMRFKVNSIVGLPSYEPNLSSTTAPELLDQFTNFQAASQPLAPADVYLLFTGKELGGAVVGIAYLGATCRFDGALSHAVSQSFHPAFDHLVAAHELGHLLSARHDIEAPSLMYPSVGAENTNFSNASISELSTHLANYGECLSRLDDGDVIVQTPLPEAELDGLVLNANFLRRRQIEVILTPKVSTPGELCFIEGYISESRSALERGLKESDFWFVTITRGEAISLTERISPRLRQERRVYVRATMTCGSGTVLSETESVTLPNGAVAKKRS